MMQKETIMDETVYNILSNWISISKNIEHNKKEIDLLALAGASRDERLYSWILYSLLVDKENKAIREAFSEMVVGLMKSENLQLSSYDVFREWSIPRGFVDLLLISEDKKKVVVIENKIDAGDQKDQLSRYYDFFEQNGYSTYLVYLSPFGHEPSEFSISAEKLNCLKEKRRFTCLSYKEDIILWLNRILKFENRDNIKSVIVQFIITIKGMLAMNDNVNKLVNLEYWKIDYSEIDRLKMTREVLDVLIYAKHATHFFRTIVQDYLLSEGTTLDASRLLYVCENNVYKDVDDWEKVVCETGFKYYGIVYSFGLDFSPQRPLYGIRLTTEGNANQFKNKTYFGIYIGKEKSNPKNLKMESHYWDDKGKYGHWGEYIEVTDLINQNDYNGIEKNFLDLIQENRK